MGRGYDQNVPLVYCTIGAYMEDGQPSASVLFGGL